MGGRGKDFLSRAEKRSLFTFPDIRPRALNVQAGSTREDNAAIIARRIMFTLDYKIEYVSDEFGKILRDAAYHHVTVREKAEIARSYLKDSDESP